MISWTSHGKP